MVRQPRRRATPAAASGGPVLSGAQISAINRFPDDNPNPVLRIDERGRLIYANRASSPVLESIEVAVGDLLPADLIARLDAAARSRGFIEVKGGNRTYAIWPVAIRDLRMINLYGTDVTAERAIVKFPDQNPNPVFRIDWDARIVYANGASRILLDGLGLTVGEEVTPPLRDDLLDATRAGGGKTLEVSSGGHVYALLPVDVPEFGFINVYGTDVTAVRERERLARENERLLLSILPEPIAERLRQGEALIADRFEDVTLLFADVVEFTRLSSTMTAPELVTILNDVFTAFDLLVDEHGLEKVKTIGDAYMVVGGMPERSDDHTARMAKMALELTRAVSRIEAARRLGVAFRIGIHAGPVVAGVIGRRRFIYDVWGDTVNVASRMESLGVPGRIQVTQAVEERLRDRFDLQPRGLIDVKGKGRLPTWFLEGRRRRTGGTWRPAVAGSGGSPAGADRR